MSLASATGQVIFSQKGGVYMPSIQCNKGDLYQEYMGEASAPTNIAPDFVSLKPVLSFILTSSRVAEGLVVPSSMNGISMMSRSSSRAMSPPTRLAVRRDISSLSLTSPVRRITTDCRSSRTWSRRAERPLVPSRVKLP